MSYKGLEAWLETETFDGLREAALSHVWFPMQQLNDVAKEGGLKIMRSGRGAKITDFDGREYYDGFAGLALVNVGYGREEIAQAVHDQLSTLHYANTFAYGTIPAIKAAEKLASLAPGRPEPGVFHQRRVGLGGDGDEDGASVPLQSRRQGADQVHFASGVVPRGEPGGAGGEPGAVGEPGHLPADAADCEGCAAAVCVPGARWKGRRRRRTLFGVRRRWRR